MRVNPWTYPKTIREKCFTPRPSSREVPQARRGDPR